MLKNNKTQSKKILIVGPLPPQNPTRSKPIGGAAVNFGEMLKQLSMRDFVLEVVDINRPLVRVRKWRIAASNVSSFLNLVCTVFAHIGKVHGVFLNGNPGNNVLIVVAYTWLICRLRGRPIVLRFFGGDFGEVYSGYAPILRALADFTMMRSDILFVQTRKLHLRFRARRNVQWFPNTRDVQTCVVVKKQEVRRLVFISRLYMCKGLREAVDACRSLPATCHLSVYGPIMPDTDMSIFVDNERASYIGVLSANDLAVTLSRYDLLLFPSYWEAEGYPGIIIEALQCGVPVIATRWRGIPEVIEHAKSGLIVEPRSTDAVRAAIESLLADKSLFTRLCEGARLRGEFFRSNRWYDRMAEQLRGVFE